MDEILAIFDVSHVLLATLNVLHVLLEVTLSFYIVNISKKALVKSFGITIRLDYCIQNLLILLIAKVDRFLNWWFWDKLKVLHGLITKSLRIK